MLCLKHDRVVYHLKEFLTFKNGSVPKMPDNADHHKYAQKNKHKYGSPSLLIRPSEAS